MGVNLSGLVSGRQIELADLRGRRIAIDAYNTLYQFLSIIRDRFTGESLRDSKGRVTSHLSGLFYRTTNLIENGIEPVFVFDGKPPAFKHRTAEMRSAVKREAEEKLEKAREERDFEAIRRYAQATSKLTGEMIENSKRLLGYMGVPVVQAPSEGEAQAAYMTNSGIAWASGSQDMDSILFGADRMVKNLTVSGRRKVARKEDYVEVRPEMIELDRVLSQLGISREQMIMTGILIGTDYNPGGVKGIGPKTALKLVKEHKTLDSILRHIKWEFDIKPEEIFGFFMNPPVSDVEIKRTKPDMTQLRDFMLDFDFSEERIAKTIERLCAGKDKNCGGLQKWLVR
jgi:flap endonuclease-1